MNKYLLSLLLFGFSITNQIICEAQEGGESESESETESETESESDDTNELLINDVTSKYIIGYFNSEEFPFATDQCQPFSGFGAPYYKYVCVDSNTIDQEVYSDSTCTTSAGDATRINTTKTGTGSAFDFDCDSTSTEAYAEVEFSLITCDTTNKEIVFAALNTCANIVASGIKLQVYCQTSPLYAQLQYFIGDDCSLSTYDSYGDVTDTCDYALETLGVDIYGTALSCVGGDTSTKSTITPYNPDTTIDNHDPSIESTNIDFKGSSATTHFNVLGLILAGLVAYFRM